MICDLCNAETQLPIARHREGVHCRTRAMARACTEGGLLRVGDRFLLRPYATAYNTALRGRKEVSELWAPARLVHLYDQCLAADMTAKGAAERIDREARR